MIADFAPHALEFLREEYAHHRLGFADREVQTWLAAAGLTLSHTDTIAPPKPAATNSPSKCGSPRWAGKSEAA